MKILRSVSALLAIGSAFSCAKAIDDSIPDDLPQTSIVHNGGGRSGGEGGSVVVGGQSNPPAGGAPAAAGAPGGAGKLEIGNGGSSSTGTGGKSGGSAGSTSVSGSTGSGGSPGVAGSSSAGGKGGTSPSGGASSGGSAGSTAVGACENPKDVTGGDSKGLGAEAACLRTKETFNNVVCYNFTGRTIKVNGVVDLCTAGKKTFAPAIDGWNYFEVSAGGLSYASVTWFTS